MSDSVTKVRFFLDENMQVAIAEQLRRRDIDVVTVRDLELLGDEDANHLELATRMNCILCTHDTDFIELAKQGVKHAGIVFGRQHVHSIGDWVKFLELVHSVYDLDDMRNLIEYVK